MEKLFGVLFSIYKGTPRHGEWVIACLQGAWRVLVGEPLARVCRPCAFSDSRLVIEITDPNWEGALRATETELLQKLRKATDGEVSSVSFKTSASLEQ